MIPTLPKQHLVRINAAFKDGNLFSQLVGCGFSAYENVPGTIMPSEAWIPERLYLMLANSGAEIEIMETRLKVPPATGPTSEPKDPEPEPEPDEFLENITLDDLNFTGPAKHLAKKAGLLPAELLDTLGEWELASGEWQDHKFSKSEVEKVIADMEV